MSKLSQADLEKLYLAVLQGMSTLKSAEQFNLFTRESNELSNELILTRDKGKIDAYLKKYPWLEKIIESQASSEAQEVIPSLQEVIPSLNMLVSSIRVVTSSSNSLKKSANSQSSGSSSGLSDWWYGPAWRPYPYGYGYYGSPYGYGPTTVIVVNNGGTTTSHHGHVASGFGFSFGGSGEEILILLAAVTIVILLVGAAAITVAATKEAYANLQEIFTELANNQRVMANLATLTLTALAVGGVIALLATNPVGWGVVGIAVAAVGFYWLCVAALVVTRSINNQIDYSASKSAISGDSRYQLTQSEEAKIRLNLQGKTEQQIDDTIAKIRVSIKALAKEVVDIGLNLDHEAVTQQLAKLKKGDLTDAPAYSSEAFKLKFKAEASSPQEQHRDDGLENK